MFCRLITAAFITHQECFFSFLVGSMLDRRGSRKLFSGEGAVFLFCFALVIIFDRGENGSVTIF